MKTLIDSYSRQIRYVRVSVTDRCNLRCRYCMPEGGVDWLDHDSIMHYEELLRVITIFASKGVEKIRITGGEPLVRKDLCDFIKYIRRIDSIKDLSLTTNGVLLPQTAQALRQAGLDRINISLDTLDRDKFAYITRVDAFEKVYRGIQCALDEYLAPVKINVVAIKGFNDDEILAFASLTLETPLEIRFIELMPMGCAARFGPLNIIQAQEIRQIIEGRFGRLDPVEYGLGPAKVYRIPGAAGRIGLIDPLSERSFCSRCNRVRITADGHLRPCLFSKEQIDILGPLRQGISDHELAALVEKGVLTKPLSGGICKGRNACVQQSCASQMSEIGG